MRDSQKNVDEILTESRAIMKEDFFKEHERDHFRGRIELIDKRNKELDEKVTQAERRYFVLKIDIDFYLNRKKFDRCVIFFFLLVSIFSSSLC